MYKDFINFVRKTYHKPEGLIPLHEPRFRGNEKKYLNECIESTFVSSVGKFVNRFEEMTAEYTGAKYAVAAMNGTAALHIALLLAGVKRDDEVITQPLTFIATTNAIAYTGAKPVFIDVDKDTMGLSPQALKEWLKKNVDMRIVKAEVEVKPSSPKPLPQPYNKKTNKRIAAIVPMHTFGHPCRIDEIVEIANEYNIPVVEDSAESLGSFYSPREIRGKNISRGKGKHTGTFGKLGVFSYNGNKTITTGGGGMIVTDDEKLAKLAKHMTTTAKVPHPYEYVHDMIGYNYRLTNLAAALGVAQMEQLEGFIQQKRKLAKMYSDFFSTFPSTSTSASTFFPEPPNARSNYWLNVVLLKDKKQRDEFLKYTNANGIMTRPVWELMNRLSMFKDCETGDLSNSIYLANKIVNIPSGI